MSQHALELGVFQDLIASSPRHQVDACFNELSDHRRVAILPIETNQSHFWGESEVLQVGRDGMQGRGQFSAIVPIASTSIGADPLARMHLKRNGPCAYHLATLAPFVAGCAHCIETASRRRKRWITGERSLSCRLPCRIDIKD